MTKPSLLFHRGTRWQGSVRGSTNVLAEYFLSAGYPVTWLGRPHHVGHVLRGFDGAASRIGTSAERWSDGALEVHPFSIAPIVKPKLASAAVWLKLAELGYRSFAPSLATTLAAAGQPEPDLIWSTGGDTDQLRRQFPKAKRILQCVDVYEAYAGSKLAKIEESDFRHADAIVSIGHSLARYLVEQRGLAPERVTVIGQGADLPLFSAGSPEPSDLQAVPHPRLVWVGVLDKADSELMKAALGALPEGRGSLILIGPVAEWATNLAAHDRRVHLTGPKPPAEVAAYLQHSDISLMLYDRDRDPRQYLGQNPLKLYEYAAAGLPIISTSHAEFEFSRPPALIADDPEAVSSHVARALAQPDELGRASRAFAEENSWQNRFEAAEQLVRHTLELD